ncbi:MAG: histidinol-phosphatase HisJ family protein [Verrucomicrobiae bacterium]|nr:histidinol-phosphatase HisJ family protein [Verrucomicrobiae bacterium]
MVLPADYHIHTKLCRHAVGEIEEYVSKAVDKGLKEIGFSDHSPMPEDDFDDWRMKFSELDSYVESIRAAQKKFPQIKIRLALEMDFIPGCEDWIKKLSALYQWDYLIGSVHYVDKKWDIDNPNKKDEWNRCNITEVWENYINRLTQAAESGLFDIIGHVDLAKKFGHFPEKDCSELFRNFLRVAKKNNTLIEINTAGLRKECRQIYPDSRILTMAKVEGVGITFGSDSHAPEEVGMDFEHAIKLAKSCGFSEYHIFESRIKKTVPLY